MDTDVLIVGSGCSGLYCALKLPRDKRVLIVTKRDVESSDSFLAQGGICMLKDESDYDSYFEDTMRAGHYENDPESVEIMIRSSQGLIKDLIGCGVDFARDENGELMFTREGAHSDKRILFHEDETGREVTSKLLEQVRKLSNVTIMEYTVMVDIVCKDNKNYGAVLRMPDGSFETVRAQNTVWACGGIGGLYRRSTNFSHLTGDALALSLQHDIRLKDINYVQVHPTTFYTEQEEDRCFLITESVRGEGAKLYDKYMNRFVDELQPRDVVTEAIFDQMNKDKTEFVWEDLTAIPENELRSHFPHIVSYCSEHGYDVTKDVIPVVPAQHYFMGGVWVDHDSRTSMEHLYAVGETACNGVHGRNRLASNSLLESMVFAGRAAAQIGAQGPCGIDGSAFDDIDFSKYKDVEALRRENHGMVRDAIAEADQEMGRDDNYHGAIDGLQGKRVLTV
ncbi:MAG: L-aspartate oxidase [Clostridiales bacterium]|nr:L-aspartate oxidase [Clostridiales bacterium]